MPEAREKLLLAAIVYWEVYRAEAGESAFVDALEEKAVRHTLACLLARVRGRSQLEYLSDLEKERQARAVLGLVPRPRTLQRLVDDFAAAIA
jgi:5-methylthioribose kinase